MRILVFDGKEINLRAAKAQLEPEHEVVIVESCDAFQNALKPRTDQRAVEERMKELFGDLNPFDQNCDPTRREEYFATLSVVQDQNTPPHGFDMVLLGLHLPVSTRGLLLPIKQDLEDRSKSGKPVSQPISFGLLLWAVSVVGVEYCGLLSDTPNFKDPASALIDLFGGCGSMTKPMFLGEGSIYVSNQRRYLRRFNPGDLRFPVSDSAASYLGGMAVEAKTWDVFVHDMLSANG